MKRLLKRAIAISTLLLLSRAALAQPDLAAYIVRDQHFQVMAMAALLGIAGLIVVVLRDLRRRP